MHFTLPTTLFTTLLYLSPNAFVSASPPMPMPTMDAALTIPPSLVGALAHPLTCLQLATMNSKLDGLIHYAFPATIPKEKAYAVASFTHAYKVLINTMHNVGCAIADDDMEFNMTMFESGMSSKAVKRQDSSDIIAILCVIIDTLLGDNGGEAIPSGSDSASARLPSATAAISRNMVVETAGSMSVVKRQDGGGDDGIVEELLELVGTILQILLGCDIGDDSGGDSGSGGSTGSL
ncbi:hypothetical protein BDV10DRAFT_187917 [Aspergillus recurvatus]